MRTLCLALIPWTSTAAVMAQDAAQAPDPSTALETPAYLRDGMSYTFKVTDQELGTKQFEVTFVVKEEERLGERYLRVEHSYRYDKLDVAHRSVFRAADLAPIEFRLEQSGRRDRDKIELENHATFQNSKYQYHKDGKTHGQPREAKAKMILPADGLFFFVGLQHTRDSLEYNGSILALDRCRASPITFIDQGGVEVDAGPLKKVPARTVVVQDAKTKRYTYLRQEDGLPIRVWPDERGEVELKEIDDLLEKVRPAFEKGEQYLAEGETRKAVSQFKKVLKVKGDFLLVERARRRLAEIEADKKGG